MRYKEITEAPLADFGAYGDLDTEGSMRSSDLKAVRNPKWVKKVHTAFSKTPYDFNLYLLNAPDGVMSFDGKYYHTRSYDDVRKYHGLISLKNIEKFVGFVPPNSEQSITVLIASNEGDERLALTPWILAHRVAHAIMYADRSQEHMKSTDLTMVLNNLTVMATSTFSSLRYRMERLNPDLMQGPKDYMVNIAHMIGKFKSARDGTIRDSGEFLVECFTQYITQGAVSFIRFDVPNSPRVPPTTPDPMLAAARAFFRENRHAPGDRFAQVYVKPRVSRPGEFYSAKDSNGELLASLSPSTSDDRIKSYTDRGCKVTFMPIKPAAATRYTNYQKKLNLVAQQYDDWIEDDTILPPLGSHTDDLDSTLTDAEENFNHAFRGILVRCIGKAFIL